MAGSPTYTSDTSLDATNGENSQLSGSITVASNVLTGFGTRFNDELKIGDSISFTNDSGTTETKLIETVSNNESATITSTSVCRATKTIVTRRRAKTSRIK